MNKNNTLSAKFSIAPMMDWTDRHCRSLHRVLSRRAVLYTEMLTAAAILHGDRDRLLAFSAAEHPVALQLGGSEPADLAAAARIGEAAGYDEINLNVGCPSDRVQSGRFGACLMREPVLVAECVAAMAAATRAPVTVKCRIGVDDQAPEHALFDLVDACAATGAHFNVRYEMASLTMMKELVMAGKAHTVLALPAVSQEIEHGLVVARKLVSPTVEARLMLATALSRPITLAMHVVAAELKAVMKSTVSENRRKFDIVLDPDAVSA